MNAPQLSNWAVMNLTKAARSAPAAGGGAEGGSAPPAPQPGAAAEPPPPPPCAAASRLWLNSDLSYYGVGSKHAAFYLGGCAVGAGGSLALRSRCAPFGAPCDPPPRALFAAL